MAEKYSNTKIFKIVSENTNDVYYSTTMTPLSKRKALMYANYKLYKQSKKKYVPAFDLFDLGSVKFILVESYPCKNKDESNSRLHHYISSNPCINNRQLPTIKAE